LATANSNAEDSATTNYSGGGFGDGEFQCGGFGDAELLRGGFGDSKFQCRGGGFGDDELLSAADSATANYSLAANSATTNYSRIRRRRLCPAYLEKTLEKLFCFATMFKSCKQEVQC
jgi:hypothetical protein